MMLIGAIMPSISGITVNTIESIFSFIALLPVIQVIIALSGENNSRQKIHRNVGFCIKIRFFKNVIFYLLPILEFPFWMWTELIHRYRRQ